VCPARAHIEDSHIIVSPGTVIRGVLPSSLAAAIGRILGPEEA
jgi:hypothetical protein